MRGGIPRSFLLLAFIVSARVGAQGSPPVQPPAHELQRANTLFVQGDWKGAFEAYSALAAAYPAHALSRFRVGVSLLELGRFSEAEANLREGERLGVPAPQAAFRLAQVLAEEKRGDAAIAELFRSAGAAFPIASSTIEGDRHLASLKGNARWREVLDAFDAVVQPCMHDPRFREFDFWVGDWDVRPTGQPPVGLPARNTVTLDDNGCVVTEHWQSPSGSVGQSFNIFDRTFGKWRQTWVDNSGGQHDYRGELKDGNMAFIGETPTPNGKPGRVPTRLTFFHIGKDSVRQYSESSTDSGRTWQPNYDLMYVRRKADSPPGAPSGQTGASAEPLSDADRAAIRALDSTFVRGWLADDTSAVLGVFSQDGVLLPPGAPPVVGLAAIRAYWWPADGSRTRITSFERRILEIEGTRRLAFVQGEAALAWEYTKSGKTSAQKSRSTELILVAPDSTGRWHVIRQMWSVLP